MEIRQVGTKHVVMYDGKKANQQFTRRNGFKGIFAFAHSESGPEDKCVYVLFPVSLKETLLIRRIT